MRKLTKEVKQSIKESILLRTEVNIPPEVVFNYVVGLLEIVDEYPIWFEEKEEPNKG